MPTIGLVVYVHDDGSRVFKDDKAQNSGSLLISALIVPNIGIF